MVQLFCSLATTQTYGPTIAFSHLLLRYGNVSTIACSSLTLSHRFALPIEVSIATV